MAPTRKPNQSPGNRQTRPRGGDGLDQMRHEIDVRTSGVSDEVGKVPGAATEPLEHALQVRHETFVEEGQPARIVIRQVASGELRRRGPISDDSSLVADWQ